MANIPISSLPEVTTIAETDYLAVDNGTTSSKIKVSKFNEESTTSAYTYMTRAETAASNASDSAAAALGYKNEVSNLITSAQTVVSDAQTYASNAQTSAGAASSSATTASNKATAAANSANQAASYAANVDSFAKEAKSWARGGTGTRVGEDTDNSMYYANEAKASEIAAASSESNAASSESNAATSESNASSSASSASTNALKAEGYAVGSQNGTPATSGETYYHDNAKYYKEEAATSATNASTSETNAGLSESAASSSASSAKDSKEDSEAWAVGKRNGVDVPSTDPTYHNNAKYWADAASGAAGGGVTSFNGRSGIVVPATHDYSANQVDYSNTTSGLAATDVQGAIDEVKGSLGTAAALNVAASGDASTSEVVKGNDSRLTDARTPVSHTHTLSNITDAGTAAAKNSTNAVTQNSTELPEGGAVHTAITDAINALDVTDSAVAGSYVTAVSETDGKVSVTREAADATPTSASEKMVKSDGVYTFVGNKHKITRKTVATTGWSSDTSSQSGVTLYKKSISLSHVYVDSPSVDISTSNGSGLPTSAQQTAYNLLQYVTIDGTTMYLYASAIPTTQFYIQIEGAD